MANLRANNLTGTGGRNAIDGSVFFDGTGDYLSIDDSADFELGSEDFTIEGWFYFRNTGSSGTAFWGKWNSPNRSYTFAYVKSTGTYTFGYSTDGSAEVLLTSAALSADIDTWVHFAAVRNGSSLKVYRNGISIIDASVGSATFYNATTDLYIGRLQSNTNYDFKGYISNFRICKGHAVYTANFTPPTQKSGLHNESVLLCCQDSDDPTQEATGKTITGFGSLQESNDTELVTNSGFTVDISGWTTSGVQWTHSSGALMHFGNGSTQRNAYQDVTTVIGKKYVARVLASSAEASTAYWQVGPTDGTVTINYVADNNNSAQLEYRYYFTADSTSTQIRFYSYDSGNSGNVRSYWYLASIKLAPQGKAPKFLPPVGIDEGVVIDGYTKINSPGVMYFPTGDTSQRGRGTALFAGGYVTPNATADIEYLSIPSGGITTKWGNLSTTQISSGQSLSSKTRQLIGGGWASPINNNTINYITIATSGNSLNFGDLVVGRRGSSPVSNDTRGIWGGGYISPADAGTPTMDYVTIASTGDAADFGDLSGNAKGGTATGSTTRAVFALGNIAPSDVNTLEYVTIATLSGSTNFGDLPSGSYGRDNGSCSSNTRGIFAGGHYPTSVNTINYITIASTGDATDFGDLFLARGFPAGTSNGIRGVFMGGTTNPARQDTIDSVIIATTGNAVNWGDMRIATQAVGGSSSDSHGGLS